jgi:hypothetical protein
MTGPAWSQGRMTRLCGPLLKAELPVALASQAQPSLEIFSAGPLAFTTPMGQDTPVPWSGQ